MVYLFVLLFCIFQIKAVAVDEMCDLTLVGRWKWRDSMGRTTIGIADCLKNDLTINVKEVAKVDLLDTPENLLPIINNENKKPGKIALLTEHPWYTFNQAYTYVPRDSAIKIAYSVIEATLIPKIWVPILNNNFDAVVVPDEWLIDVYRNSGVTKPIFVLPHVLYLEDFLKEPLKKRAHSVFTFGISAGFWSWKNHKKVLKAFAREFGNRKDVRLLMHGRMGDISELVGMIKKYKLSNVKIILKEFSQEEYIKFLKSLDCYVFLSRGEGFSITPREAMALGIPVILSNNTAHKTICKTGLVRSVRSKIQKKAYYESFAAHCGVNFDCKTDDACEAMRDVYKNYDEYLDYAQKARSWTKRYLQKNLKEIYLALIKPQKIELAQFNSLEKNCLKTNSQELYNKYVKIMQDYKN